MDISGTLFTAGVGVITSGIVYIIGKTVSLDKIVAAHINADTVIFDRFLSNFTDLKTELRDQSQKLDRLVESTLMQKPLAAAAASDIHTAAAQALTVVEAAKLAAIEVVATAAAQAKKAL